jgi:zinc protease
VSTFGQPTTLPAPDATLSRTRLDNGLTVVLGEHDAADVAAVQLWFRVGGAHEADAEAGLSHFIEHLLFKGTPTRGPGVVDRTISGLGGEMNAATSHDFTYYHLVVPAEHLDTALDVMADVARHASLDPTEIDRERLVVLEEIRRAHDSPGGYLWRLLARHHFPGHPYGRPVLGTPEVIAGAGRPLIVDYHRRHYVPNRAVLVVVGRLDPETTLAHVQREFGPWPAGAAEGDSVPPAAGLTATAHVEEPRPVGQVYLAAAWRGPTVPDEDVHAADVLAAVLGTGRASRLNQALKERRRLVTSVGATFYPQKRAGTLTVTARTGPADRRAAEEALLEEIERVRAVPVEPAELARAITAVEAAHAFEHETAEGAAYAYGAAETLWTLDVELEYLERVRRVTREDVQAAARRHLAPGRFTAAALVPADPTR